MFYIYSKCIPNQLISRFLKRANSSQFFCTRTYPKECEAVSYQQETITRLAGNALCVKVKHFGSLICWNGCPFFKKLIFDKRYTVTTSQYQLKKVSMTIRYSERLRTKLWWLFLCFCTAFVLLGTLFF